VAGLASRYGCHLDLEKNRVISGPGILCVDGEKYLPLYSSDIQRANLRLSVWEPEDCVIEQVPDGITYYISGS